MSIVAKAISDFSQGKIVIITDDEDRENEGDLVAAGSLITAETVNFMITYGKGLVCAPVSEKITKRLNLPQMTEKNTECTNCKFTISVDFKYGTTTGISAYDRSKTIKALSDPNTKAEDFLRPGHIFPLLAENEGLKVRRGQTEAAIELTKLAKLPPVGVICEIIHEDGYMCRGKNLEKFAKNHNLVIISVEELNTFIQT